MRAGADFAVVVVAVVVGGAISSVACAAAVAAGRPERRRAPLDGASTERGRRNRHGGAPRDRNRALKAQSGEVWSSGIEHLIVTLRNLLGCGGEFFGTCEVRQTRKQF